MVNIARKIKEVVGAVDNLTKFEKFSKLKASYIEYDKFADSNLHQGYFCYNCIYWINSHGGKCMLVKSEGIDVMGKESDVIAPHGCCAGYEPNYDKLDDTPSGKQNERVTSADVTDKNGDDNGKKYSQNHKDAAGNKDPMSPEKIRQHKPTAVRRNKNNQKIVKDNKMDDVSTKTAKEKYKKKGMTKI